MVNLIAKMSILFKNINSTGILVIGDLIVDQYIEGNVTRISPEAPVPIVDVTSEKLLLGGSANVAGNISSIGGRVFITGVIGNDEMGNVLKQKLKDNKIDTRGIIVDKKRNTILKTRIYAHDQQVVRFDKEIKSDISSSSQAKIIDYVKKLLPDIKAIILSDYCKGVITGSLIRKILKVAGSKVFVAVDPKVGHFHYYKGVNFITPNLNEASHGSGIEIQDDKTLKKAGRILLKKLKSDAVLITMGDKGMILFEKNGRIIPIPTYAKEVYDVTGAGDTVIAAFTLCYSSGAKLEEAAEFANYAAGIVVGKHGAASATVDELRAVYPKNKTF